MATRKRNTKPAPAQESKPNPVPKQQQPATDWWEILKQLEW
jgi:hypothetical protein